MCFWGRGHCPLRRFWRGVFCLQNSSAGAAYVGRQVGIAARQYAPTPYAGLRPATPRWGFAPNPTKGAQAPLETRNHEIRLKIRLFLKNLR
jgi:hypothetical protein